MRLIIGNLKMNLSSNEIEEYISLFKEKNYSNVFFAPSSIYLSSFVKNGLNTVSQDVSGFSEGAYTGDISASQLKSIGVTYSLVGHSERRKYYDDNKYVNEKIKRLLEYQMTPILCIGESLLERNNQEYLNVIKNEITNGLQNIKKEYLKSVIIAYEPLWSIGTGIVPSNTQIDEVISYIKKYVSDTYSFDIKVLYGGSVSNNNIKILESISSLDGYLVGGTSLKKNEFCELIESVK